MCDKSKLEDVNTSLHKPERKQNWTTLVHQNKNPEALTAMNSRDQKRSMSQQERDFLDEALKSKPSSLSRWMRGVQNAVVLWAITMMLFVFAWKFLAWLVRIAISVEFGWSSNVALWIVIAGALGCASYAIVSSVRWVKKWPDSRAALQADLQGGKVIEESYEFTGARRFQEREHGGLIYFLRTTDEKVFVLYDYESQNLGVQNENPLKSGFCPTTKLLLVRAPKSDLVISREYSGAKLDVGEPQALSIPPQSWPEDETFCKFGWNELEVRLTKTSRRSKR